MAATKAVTKKTYATRSSIEASKGISKYAVRVFVETGGYDSADLVAEAFEDWIIDSFFDYYCNKVGARYRLTVSKLENDEFEAALTADQ